MKYTDGSRLSSRSESPKSQKANEEHQGFRNRNSSKLTKVMTEDVTVQISIKVKQKNRTKTSDAII
jgi:hypothetical protein